MTYSDQHKFGSTVSRCFLAVLLIPLILVYTQSISKAEPKLIKNITLEGDLIKQDKKPNIRDNISGISIKGDILVVGSDEGADILVFKKEDDLKYNEAAQACIPLDGKSCGKERKGTEIDIEGIAWSKKYLYVIGSHSRARKRVKADKSSAENRKRLETVKIEPTREQLFRLKLDKEGKIVDGSKVKKISLRNLFANHKTLSLFQTIPSKENGIDIEGLAVKKVDDKDRLYLGFRGPVLRGNHAIIMILDFKKDKFKLKKNDPKIHYVNLDGRGIRGMTETGNGGFILLAGPVGDAKMDNEKTRYQLYFWNGEEDDVAGVVRKPLCSVPVRKGAKAEGIELLNKGKADADDYQFVVVYDGAKKGGATFFTCKP
ncbi:DUF3616 domain-containing protein [Desulfococcaceae bacterium HSG7]|nr:DUF3616 domain-containing protein [Desulfococcaceae bacterium HSG9]MDM8553535.1 DUF3616 domain-containing protein [Desulfococcaceae bacterium HSG7]